MGTVSGILHITLLSQDSINQVAAGRRPDAAVQLNRAELNQSLGFPGFACFPFPWFSELTESQTHQSCSWQSGIPPPLFPFHPYPFAEHRAITPEYDGNFSPPSTGNAPRPFFLLGLAITVGMSRAHSSKLKRKKRKEKKGENGDRKAAVPDLAWEIRLSALKRGQNPLFLSSPSISTESR